MPLAFLAKKEMILYLSPFLWFKFVPNLAIIWDEITALKHFLI